MSGKLDKSLDEILSTTRPRGGAGAGRRRSQRRSAGRPATTAPVGGIQKIAKPARTATTKAAPAKAAARGDSKVIVSNLPKDVSEQQIKEYFVQSVGPIKKVELSYGPNSVSRGIANVIFRDADGASKAFNKLNGLLVDQRPIKIEIVVSDAQAATVLPPSKTLAERTSQPKAQPKSAATDKHNANGAKGSQTAGRGGRGKKARGRNSRPTKKTAEELDSEMADYFQAGNNENNASAAAPANGDAPMEDEIM